MATWLEEHGVELVVLAGYMHLLTEPFLERFPDRIVNVHPSLLPAFPGAHAIDDALAAGVETTGVTVHLVDEGLDTGPVLAQEEVAGRAARDARRADPRGRAPAAARGGERAVPRRALISVYDKEGVEQFARGLVELGWELVSSGGTATFLAEQGLPVTTRRGRDRRTGDARRPGQDAPPAHPRRHPRAARSRRRPASARRAGDRADRPRLREPLSLRVGRGPPGATEAEIVEMIDVGGPSMLRAAAKNFAHVTVVSDLAQYDVVLAELREHGDTTLDTRRTARARRRSRRPPPTRRRSPTGSRARSGSRSS